MSDEPIGSFGSNGGRTTASRIPRATSVGGQVLLNTAGQDAKSAAHSNMLKLSSSKHLANSAGRYAQTLTRLSRG